MATRQDRADDTRKRLFAAAVEMFSEAGYHDTTVDAIARRAGVAKGTFFVHFPTKAAVIVELVRIQTAHARQARQAALGAGPIAALRATTRALGEQAGLSRELSRAVLAATLESPAIAGDADALFDVVLAEMIDDAKRARALLRTGVSPEHLARGLLAAYLGAAYHFASNPRSASMNALLAPLVDAFLQGTLEDSSHVQSRRRPVTRSPRMQLSSRRRRDTGRSARS